MGGFTHRWKSWFWVGKLSLKLMRVKDLIKKHKKAPPFLRARADILPMEERKRNKKKGGEMNWFLSE